MLLTIVMIASGIGENAKKAVENSQKPNRKALNRSGFGNP